MSIMNEVDLNKIKLPEDLVGENEKVIGELPKDLRTLYAALLEIGKNLELSRGSIGEINGELAGHQKEAVLLYARECQRVNFVREFFWAEVHQRFPQSNEFDITTIRADWKVVVFNNPGPKVRAITAVSLVPIDDLFPGFFL